MTNFNFPYENHLYTCNDTFKGNQRDRQKGELQRTCSMWNETTAHQTHRSSWRPLGKLTKTKMSSESLEKLGLFFDELNRLRVWEPEAADRTNDLKDECKEFVKSTSFLSLFSVYLFCAKWNMRDVLLSMQK